MKSRGDSLLQRGNGIISPPPDTFIQTIVSKGQFILKQIRKRKICSETDPPTFRAIF